MNKLPTKGLTNFEIVKALRKSNENIVQLEREDIIEIGLAKLVVEVSKWRSGAQSSTQIELFKEYDLPKTYTIRIPGKKPIHKKLNDVTYQDAKIFVEQHEKPPIQSHEVAEVARFLEFAESVKAKPTDRLVDIWEREHGAGSASAG